jgi:hypothetical protein
VWSSLTVRTLFSRDGSPITGIIKDVTVVDEVPNDELEDVDDSTHGGLESASRGPRIQHTDQTDGHDESAGGGVEAVADEVGVDVFEEGLDPAFVFCFNLVDHIILVALEGEVALLLRALAAYFVEGSSDTAQSVSVELFCFGAMMT